MPYQHEMTLGKYPDIPSLSRETIVEGVRMANRSRFELRKPGRQSSGRADALQEI